MTSMSEKPDILTVAREALDEWQERLRVHQVSAELAPKVLGTPRDVLLAKAVIDLSVVLDKAKTVIQAAEHIHHWHDTGNGGMIVSAQSVFLLWDALESYNQPAAALDGKDLS